MLHQGLQVEHHWQFGEIVQFAEEVGGVFDVGGKFGVQWVEMMIEELRNGLWGIAVA